MTCPFCATDYAIHDPISTPPGDQCSHWIYRLSTTENAVLLLGRTSWDETSQLLPALTWLPEDDPGIGELLIAAYPEERATGDIEPLVEAVADGWQLDTAEAGDASFVDYFIEGGRDRAVEQIEDVIHTAQWARSRGYRPDSGERPPARPRPRIQGD